MSKVIKVENQVYEDLDKMRSKGETFSQEIEALLEARQQWFRVLNQLEGALKYREWQEERLRELQNQ